MAGLNYDYRLWHDASHETENPLQVLGFANCIHVDATNGLFTEEVGILNSKLSTSGDGSSGVSFTNSGGTGSFEHSRILDTHITGSGSATAVNVGAGASVYDSHWDIAVNGAGTVFNNAGTMEDMSITLTADTCTNLVNNTGGWAVAEDFHTFGSCYLTIGVHDRQFAMSDLTNALGVHIWFGNGAPLGGDCNSSDPGSIYINPAGSAGHNVYVCSSGSWIPKW